MKIGILTLPFNNNYGGYLQAIALLTILKQMGHQPEIINRRNVPTIQYRVKYFLSGLKGIVFRSKNRHSLFIDTEKDYYIKGAKILPAIQRFLYPITDPVYTSKALRKCYGSKYDAYIVGSDQVWRPEYVPGIEDFFLSFVENVKSRKISYAASFGCDYPQYNTSEIKTCGKLISSFSSISLREQSGKEVFKNMGWDSSKVKIVLDPTFLCPPMFYQEMTRNICGEKHSLCCYVLDINKNLEQIISYAEKLIDCKAYYIMDSIKWKQRHYVMPSVQEWLWEIINSEFVITDSFHGTVFSIIFNKPFITYSNSIRGNARIVDLLRYFNLEDRIVNTKCNFEKIVDEIDWKSVNLRLSKGREESLDFLQESLK